MIWVRFISYQIHFTVYIFKINVLLIFTENIRLEKNYSNYEVKSNVCYIYNFKMKRRANIITIICTIFSTYYNTKLKSK